MSAEFFFNYFMKWEMDEKPKLSRWDLVYRNVSRNDCWPNKHISLRVNLDIKDGKKRIEKNNLKGAAILIIIPIVVVPSQRRAVP